MKKLILAPILVLFLQARQAHSQAEDLTPFCKTCTCTYEPDQDPDVDCSRVYSVDLFCSQFWFYGENNTKAYRIRSLKAQFVELTEINSQFPESNLSKLDLSNNSIVKIEPLAFANLENMTELVLSHNDLSLLAPESFRGVITDSRDYPLRALKIFKVSHNNLHTLDQDLFEHMDGIEVLDVSHNPFKVIDTQTQIAINSLVYLKQLDLSYTEIKELPQYFLHTPKYLNVLDLSGNNFEGIPQPLSDTHELETLYFNNNPIENLTKENGFPVSKTIKSVHLCNMPLLKLIGEGALSGLYNVEELHIADNRMLNDIDTKALTRKDEDSNNEIWPPLRKVYLQNNQLTYLDFHLILKWDGLIELDIRGNPWTCECENQWLVDELMPAYLKINETMARELICFAPVEMRGQYFYDLYEKKSEMRCLDMYGNRPEKDAMMLVGILAGLLIGIPLVLFIMFAYQRNCFGIFDNSPAAFSRQFYSRTSSDDVIF